ncbi:MAG TPA: GNAT family N-acetyltransferase [Polyangiaceae bacterium]|nr:GNAT family N-acetyltransferase [Polyangiaceae bacterium]
MSTLAMVFRRPSVSDEAAVAEAQRIMAPEGFDFALPTLGDDFAEWLDRVEDCRLGRNLAEWMVPATFEVVVVDGQIAGRLSVRHELNEFLRLKGGHIGYGVLPEFRGRGVGKRLLQRGLEITQSLGIRQALVTCDADNFASRRIIESAGGLHESNYLQPGVSIPTRRYWIPTSGS